MIYGSRKHPIDRALVNRIFSMAENRMSQRKISLVISLDRRTVAKIFAGEPLACETPECPPRLSPSTRARGSPRRCGVCGAMVYPPCLLCVEKITEVPRRVEGGFICRSTHVPNQQEIEDGMTEIKLSWTEEQRQSRQVVGPKPFVTPTLASEICATLDDLSPAEP